MKMYEHRRHRQRRPSLSEDDDNPDHHCEASVVKFQRQSSITDDPDECSNTCKSTERRRGSVSDDEEDKCDSIVNNRRRLSFDNTNDITGEDTTDEIKYLQRHGILPKDFPSVTLGDYDKYDDNDFTEEIKVLLAEGAITAEDAELMRRNWESSIKSGKLLDSSSSRIKIPPFNKNGIPVVWTDSYLNSKTHRLVKIEAGEDVYDSVTQEFHKVNIQINKIERLENMRQLRRFKSEMEDIQNHRESDFDLNIQYLYHGTNVDLDRICEEGLDQRLSRMGYFGKGIYFSDNPLKCVHYSEDCTSPAEAYILMCRVILGTTKVYRSGCYDTTLKREPEKEDQSDGWRYYDSVMGCPKDFNEYVVYENRRALIEYIISFTIDKHLAEQIRGSSNDSACKHGGKDSFKQSCPGKDDHLQKISEVRERVRRKRSQEKGIIYSQPSPSQQIQDKEMWLQLQELHLRRELVSDSQVLAQPTLSRDFRSDSGHSNRSSPESPDLFKVEAIGLTDENEAIESDVIETDPVDQVLSSCMVEFMAVTDCDDSCIARHYVQKALQDVNLAISLYFEDM